MSFYKPLIVLIAIGSACGLIFLILWLLWHFKFQKKQKTCNPDTKSLTQCVNSNSISIEPSCNENTETWYCPNNLGCDLSNRQELTNQCSMDDMKCTQNVISKEYGWQCICGTSLIDSSTVKCDSKYNAPSMKCLNNNWTCYCDDNTPLNNDIITKCSDVNMEPVCVNNEWSCKCGSNYVLNNNDNNKCNENGLLLCNPKKKEIECFCGSSSNSQCDRSLSYPSCDNEKKWNCISCNNSDNKICSVSNQRKICDTNGSFICQDFNLCNENYTTSCLPNENKTKSKLYYLVGYTGFNALLRSIFHLKCVNFADDIGKCLSYALGPGILHDIYNSFENKDFLPCQCLNSSISSNNNKLCSRSFCPKPTSLPNELNNSKTYAGCIFPSSLLTEQLKNITSQFSYTNTAATLTRKPISDIFSFDQSKNYGKTPCILVPVPLEDYSNTKSNYIKYVLLPGITVIQSSTKLNNSTEWNEKTFNYSLLYYAITPRSFPIQQFHPFLLWRFVPLFPTNYQNETDSNNRSAYSNLIDEKSFTYNTTTTDTDSNDYIQPIGEPNALFFFLGHLSSFTMINTQNNFVPDDDSTSVCRSGCSGGQENNDFCGGINFKYQNPNNNPTIGQFFMNTSFENNTSSVKDFQINYGQFFKTGSFPKNKNLKGSQINNPGIIGYADMTNNGFTLYKSPYNNYFSAESIPPCCSGRYCSTLELCQDNFKKYEKGQSGIDAYNASICEKDTINNGFQYISYHLPDYDPTKINDINKNFFIYDTNVPCGGQFLTSPFQDPLSHGTSSCPQRQNAIYFPEINPGAAANLYYDGHSSVFNIMNLSINANDVGEPSLTTEEAFQKINHFSNLKMPFVNYTYSDHDNQNNNNYNNEIKENNPNKHFTLFSRDPNSSFITPIQYGLTPTIKQLTCFLETYTWNADFTDWIALGILYYSQSSQEITIRNNKTNFDINLQNYLWVLSQITFSGNNTYNSNQTFGNQTANSQNYDLGTIASDGTNSIYRWSFALQIKSTTDTFLYYICPTINGTTFTYYDFGSLKDIDQIKETSSIKGSDELFIKPLFLSTEQSTGPTQIYDSSSTYLNHYVHPSGSIYCEFNNKRYFLCVLFCYDSTKIIDKEMDIKNLFLLTTTENVKKIVAYIDLQNMAQYINQNKTYLEKENRKFIFQYKNYFIHFECAMFNLIFPLGAQDVCSL